MSQYTSEDESISQIIEYRQSRIKTAIPAFVLSISDDKERVSVKVPFEESYETVEGDETEEWGEAHDVPIQWPSGGSGSLTFEIEKGDSVLLICSARSIDEWYDSDGTQVIEPLSPRMHDLSDAFAIPGIRPKSKKLGSDALGDGPVLANGSSRIEIKKDAEINTRCTRLNIGADSASTPLTKANILEAQITAIQIKIDAMGAILGIPPLVLVGDIKSTKAFTND